MNTTPFEIHITTTELDELLLAEFVDFCVSISAKPIVIELPEGRQRQQPMISKVVKLEDPQEIHGILSELEAAFVAAGFPVERVKVEVPVPFIAAGKSAFPKYYGGYYEWHGKVVVDDAEALAGLLGNWDARMSGNALKGQMGTRLVTVRDYRHSMTFENKVRFTVSYLESKGYQLLKQESEYCVYDSNKQPDTGWLDVPDITDSFYHSLLAFEAIIRRVATVDAPFMLKGSMVLRQYLPEPSSRLPGDLDFVYLEDPGDEENARQIFAEWMTAVTTAFVDDNVQVRNFKENAFWRRLDYAMHDDFPTTNTDLLCTLPDGTEVTVQLDISWNLPIPGGPVPLNYQPETGSPFVVLKTVPIPLQLSWKMHQSVVQPRPKDLMDIILLLEAYKISEEERRATLQAFRDECQKDGFSPNRLQLYTNGLVERHFEIEDKNLAATTTEMRTLEDELSVFGDYSLDVFNLKNIHVNFPKLGRRFSCNTDLVRAFSQALVDNGLDRV